MPSFPPPHAPPKDRAPAGLYLHLPFCFHKCHYCDFFSVVEADGQQSDRQDAFCAALIRELEHQATRHTLRPRTIFVGGGTPTYLRLELWQRLLERMRALEVLDGVEEFTVEANPETVTLELMQLLASYGVNRTSIGAQSFNKTALKTLERWHNPESVPRAMDLCRAAGIKNLNLDLIFAIPGQTLAQLDEDLSELLRLQPQHLSTYGLTYEPNTALSARLKAGRVTPIGEDLEREMYALALSRLEGAGFEHYEVSNWTKKDPTRNLRCAHNMLYWQNGEWLGLGPAAASHLADCRWKNAPNLPRYLDGCTQSPPAPPIEDFECLPMERRIGEQLMLGLRLSEGVKLDWLADVLGDGGKTAKRRLSAIFDMEQIKMLERTPTHLRLTRAGLFVADAVIGKLV